jgi:hypothetical protein
MAYRTARRSCRLTFLDVLVLVLLAPLVLAFAFACGSSGGRSSERANRIKCASNLRQIGQALLLYANENRGAFPRTTYVAGDPPVWGTGVAAADPFGSGGPAPNDVTAAIYLLLRTQDISTEMFVCASSNAVKDPAGQADKLLVQSNFTDVRQHLSYSFHNPYPHGRPEKGLSRIGSTADFAIAADINPGVSGATGDVPHNVLAPTVKSKPRIMRQANSGNHDTQGQNVLYRDGRVEFQPSAFAGMDKDNIYTTRSGGVAAPPDDALDSVLLPTDD